MPVQVRIQNEFDATLCAKETRKLIHDIEEKIFSVKEGENIHKDIENQLDKMVESCNIPEHIKNEIWRDFRFLEEVVKGKREDYRRDYITGKIGIAQPNEVLLDLENEIRDYALISIENKGKDD